MFISGFFTFIGTILLWILGIGVAIFVLVLVCHGISAAVSAIKQRKQKFKPSRSHIKYTKRYRKNYKKKLKKNKAEKKCVSDCSVSNTAQTVQNSHYGSVDTSDNEKKPSLNKETENSLGNSAVNSFNFALENSSSSKDPAALEDSDYEKHKDEVYYRVRDKILSDGEELLKPHLLKFIDKKKYKLIDSPNYSRYLIPAKRADKKFEDISASKIKGLVGDFGIETLDGKPICIIEYDDATHLAKEREIRDRFLHSACKRAKFPRVSIKSCEYNSFKELSKRDMYIFYKTLYKKLHDAEGNPLDLPSLTCDKCNQEFLVNVGSYGLFLSHGRNNECKNKINIIGDVDHTKHNCGNNGQEAYCDTSSDEYPTLDDLLNGRVDIDDGTC